LIGEVIVLEHASSSSRARMDRPGQRPIVV
jgi:hypothetical protein